MALWTTSQLIETYSNRRIDPEFFNPEYIKAEKETLQCHTEKLGRLGYFVPGPFGSAFHAQNYDFKSPYRYIRGRDVKPFFLLDDDNRHIPERDFDRLAKYSVLPQDLMISVVGTLGNVAICTDDDTPAVFSCKSSIFRGKEIDPHYLLAYLNSYYGRICLLRRQRGAVQTGLNLEDLRGVPVPRFDNNIEKEIAILVQSAYTSAKQAKDSYSQAQHFLASGLGLDKLKFTRPVGYQARFSELKQSRRLDAQHFQPRFEHIISQLSEFNAKRVRDIRSYNRRGVQPIYFEAGTVGVINSQHIGRQHIDYDGLQKTSNKAFAASPEGHIKLNDLLIYTTGAYIGRTNVYLSNQPALASNHVNILRLNRGIDAAYMSLVFQSIVGQYQTQKHARGSAQAELYPADIDRFIVPLLDLPKQNAIGHLVRKSLEQQKESKRLLHQAKTRVEQLIAEGVRK